MKKTLFKDVAHLYYPCMIAVIDKGDGGIIYTDKMKGFTESEAEPGKKIVIIGDHFGEEYFEKIKPVLRKLDSLTEDEMKELYLSVFNRKFVGDNITHRDKGTEKERIVMWSGVERLFIYMDGNISADSDLQLYRVHQPTIFNWYLEHEFDLFQLIENEEAIDKKLIPQQ